MASVNRSEVFCSPFEVFVPTSGVNDSLMSQDLPAELKNGYKRIHALCRVLHTPPIIHGYARERYKTVYQSEMFLSESQPTVVAGCLFTAYEAMERSVDGERNISYSERSRLAREANHGVRRVIAALDELFNSTPVRHVPRSPRYRDLIVDNPIEPISAVLMRIESFVKCLSIPSGTLHHATAHIKFLYEEVHCSAGFSYSEQPAVVAGCLYIAMRQLRVPHTFWEIRIVTAIPTHELEAVVKDLEKFFAGDSRVEHGIGQEVGQTSHGRGSVSSSGETSAGGANKVEGSIHV